MTHGGEKKEQTRFLNDLRHPSPLRSMCVNQTCMTRHRGGVWTPTHKQSYKQAEERVSIELPPSLCLEQKNNYGSSHRELSKTDGNKARRVSTQIARCRMLPQREGSPSKASLRT